MKALYRSKLFWLLIVLAAVLVAVRVMLAARIAR